MPQPKRKPPPPPVRRRLAAVPANPPDPPTRISRRDAVRLLTRLADRAEANGDDKAAERYRTMLDEVAVGFEFRAFLHYRVE